MPNRVKISLEAINKVSRQLLSQLDMQIEISKTSEWGDNEVALDINASKKTEKILLTDEQMLSLVTERQALMTKFFDVHPQEQLIEQLPLINQMISLDEQLTLTSQHHKKMLATRLLKLKKSKKVSNMYKKY